MKSTKHLSGSSRPFLLLLLNSIFIAIISIALGAVSINALGLCAAWSWFQKLLFAAFTGGAYFVYSLVIVGLLFLLLKLFRLNYLIPMAAALFDFLVIVYLAADTFVYPMYRTHLNLAMLQMTFLGGGRIVSFSLPMIVEIIGYLVVISTVIALFFKAARRVSGVKIVGIISLVCLLGFIWANVYYAWGFVHFDTRVTTVPEKIPLARPLRMNNVFIKLGLVNRDAINANSQKIQADGSSNMKYPLEPLTCHGGKRYNILFLFVDTLRYDMLTADVMPNTYAFSKKNITFTNHYSNGNNTRHGIFSLFTGLPGSYWKKALTGSTPGILITALQDAHYNIGIFAGAPLDMPEFHKTIFSSIKGLRIDPRGDNSVESDKFAVEDFEKWQQSIKNGEPFFGFIFLDSVHAYDFPREPKYEVFKPYWKNVNHLELSNSFDPAPYLARYKNAVRYADDQIENVLKFLEEKKLMDNTIVVISSDHGDEFNDNKLNYWSHGGNFTDPQVKVPLVIHWPGKEAREVNYLTSHLDLVPTILPEVLGCTNPTKDYSVGQSIWEPENRRDWVYVSGYSLDGFVEPDRIVLINRAGMLEHLDKTFRPAPDKDIPNYMPEVLEELRRYSK
ncbi:sulfatase-like hydrolase/transferase [Parasutterella muris]|uniref:Sulfatase-like hydrolase/transferase n=2 Tax=Parasutterella TaxID=577310 RepID=A0A6L6YF42_9BURK|nr:sulfatase-like hydrolase/transferase [Parasutterella muris]MVX56216.1 sulfatase-like hydrolase/transferase [Parasutterella muris]